MPLERHYVQYGVTKEAMCDVASMAVQELMHQFVRTVSPNWTTVRMEVMEGPMQTWNIRLSGEGVRRG